MIIKNTSDALGDSNMRNPMKTYLAIAMLAVAAGLISFSSSNANADSSDITTAKSGEWASYGRDYNEQRYSPVKQITADNISKL